MTTYLNVPFARREEAKAKGARWDNEARKWFVPIGRDLEPFTTWLPVDPAKLASRGTHRAPTKGVPLSQLLAGVATAVEQAFQARRLDDGRGGARRRRSVTFTSSSPSAMPSGSSHSQGARDRLGRATSSGCSAPSRSRDGGSTGRWDQGPDPCSKPEFSAQYGLTLHVDAIDPSYTLGDLEAKKRQIREQLKADGVFDRNRQLPDALGLPRPPRRLAAARRGFG